jgi:hypothetical protein
MAPCFASALLPDPGAFLRIHMARTELVYFVCSAHSLPFARLVAVETRWLSWAGAAVAAHREVPGQCPGSEGGSGERHHRRSLDGKGGHFCKHQHSECSNRPKTTSNPSLALLPTPLSCFCFKFRCSPAKTRIQHGTEYPATTLPPPLSPNRSVYIIELTQSDDIHDYYPSRTLPSSLPCQQSCPSKPA